MSGFEIKERQKEIAILAAIAVLCAVLGYIVFIKPVQKEIGVTRTRVRVSLKKHELLKEIVEFRKTLAQQEFLLGVLADRQVLVGRISDAASQEKIDVQSVTPKTEPVGAYAKLVLDVDMRASYFSLLKFLKVLEAMTPSFKVKNVNIAQVRFMGTTAEDVPPLQCRLVLEAMLKQRV